MKKRILIASASLIVLSMFVFNCKTPKGSINAKSLPVDNSKTSLDWDGIYRGVLPCTDCGGIKTTLTVSKNLSYRLKLKYLGKEESDTEYNGRFSWNTEGNTITLDNAGTMPVKYWVGENTLTQLDKNGNKITGELSARYILSKSAYAIVEKYWKLTELYGKPVNVDSTFKKEPHIIFKDENGMFNGHGGCNSISGRYELPGLNKIRITSGISSLMACSNMKLEKDFLKALTTADNFTIAGDMLVLNKARMAPLARFKTVVMN